MTAVVMDIRSKVVVITGAARGIGNNSREAQRQPGFRRIAGRPLRRDHRGRSGRRDGGLHYTTSKAAVIDLTRGLAQELGRDRIRVNTLAPSAVLTDGIREFFGDRLDRALDARSGRGGDMARFRCELAL